MAKTDLLQGTLDLLVLKILTLGPNHGWGISNRIRQMSKEGLTASQGSLYPPPSAGSAGLRCLGDDALREQQAGPRVQANRGRPSAPRVGDAELGAVRAVDAEGPAGDVTADHIAVFASFPVVVRERLGSEVGCL